jgi:hypothetical protein
MQRVVLLPNVRCLFVSERCENPSVREFLREYPGTAANDCPIEITSRPAVMHIALDRNLLQDEEILSTRHGRDRGPAITSLLCAKPVCAQGFCGRHGAARLPTVQMRDPYTFSGNFGREWPARTFSGNFCGLYAAAVCGAQILREFSATRQRPSLNRQCARPFPSTPACCRRGRGRRAA